MNGINWSKVRPGRLLRSARVIYLVLLVALTPLSAEVDEERYQAALKKWQNGQYEASLEVIRDIIKGNMDVYKLRFLAAHNHWKLRHYEPARIHFEAALSINPNEKGAHIDLGRFYLDFGHYSSARKVASKGIELKGGNVELYNIMARAYFGLKDYKSSLAFVYKSKAEKPDNPEAVFLEGINNLQMGKFEKAEFLLGWARSLNPSSLEINYNLGVAYKKMGDNASNKKKALDYYQKGLFPVNMVYEKNEDYLDIKSLRSSLKSKISSLE